MMTLSFVFPSGNEYELQTNGEVTYPPPLLLHLPGDLKLPNCTTPAHEELSPFLEMWSCQLPQGDVSMQVGKKTPESFLETSACIEELGPQPIP